MDKHLSQRVATTLPVIMATSAPHFTTTIWLHGIKTKAMIDSGATTNVIDTNFIQTNDIPVHRKTKPYYLTTADGSDIETQTGKGLVDTETESIELRLPQENKHHSEKIKFDVVGLATRPIILGIPWLRKWNPIINWKNSTIQIQKAVTTKPERRGRDSPEQGQEWSQGNQPLSTDRRPSPAPLRRTKETVEICAISQRTIGRILRTNPDSVLCLWCHSSESINSTNQEENYDEHSHYEGKGKHPQKTQKKTTDHRQLPDELRDFANLFEDSKKGDELPPHRAYDHEIKLVPENEPKFGPIYRLSEVELTALREYIDTNVEKGYIRPSTSPAGSPILFVPKKDGKLRLCVDYRKLNDITRKDRYALPLIQELQDRFQGTQWFTKLDIPEAYHKIRIKRGDEWKTAFRSRYGHYEYTVMPFGLTNAPASFQRFINDILREHLDKFVTVYLDDILIYTKGNKSLHTHHIQAVLKKLEKAELNLKVDKCEFYKQEIEYLGSVITTTGIRMDPSKIQSIQEWPDLRSVKDVQSFLGLTGYYRQFIQKYSQIAAPMTYLLRKDTPFEWAEKQKQAFAELKSHFTIGKLLQYFDPTKQITIETDASDTAIGACLSQSDDETRRLRPVAFYSRKMNSAELNYDIYDKELLAIVQALQEWRVYCEGAQHQVKILTDHKNLSFFMTTKQLNRRQTRWAETLARYNFIIQYQKGSENARADALSRRPDYVENEKPKHHAILRKTADGLTYHTTAATSILQPTDECSKILQRSYLTCSKGLLQNLTKQGNLYLCVTVCAPSYH